MENNLPSLKATTADPPGQAPVKATADGEPFVDDETHCTLKLLAEDVDRFIASLSPVPDKANSPAPEITASAETYADAVEAELERNGSSPLAANSVLVDSLGRLGKLNTLLGVFLPGEKTTSWLSRTSAVLQKAVMLWEDELRNILEGLASNSGSSSSFSSTMTMSPSEKTTKHFSSFHNHLYRHQDPDSGIHRCNSATAMLDPDPYPTEEDDFPAISDETVVHIRAVVAAMIASGYEMECCQLYNALRRNAFKSAIKRRGFRKLGIDEIGKMSWEQLESRIATWNRVVRHTARILYPRECSLCSEVFSNYPTICEGIMRNLARAVVILFLNFAEGVAATKRAAERLFKVIEVYETLTELRSAMGELQSEILAVQRRLGDAAVAILSDLEGSVRNDPVKNTVPGGAVHPLTRYTVNYLRYACDFRDSLEAILARKSSEAVKVKSALSMELTRVLSLLDANLDAKSRQYKDASLRCVFLMNNGRYILQKIKEAPEMHELVGRVASRKRSTELRAHHKSYQRETWSKVLQCLGHEGLQLNGKVHKPLLKERFKGFNQMLDEIHRTQSAWVVSDEQLQSELRVSVSSVMIPAYRSFVARFGQYFTPGRQVEKYIKYHPEDIEATIEDLFDGNPAKTKKGLFDPNH